MEGRAVHVIWDHEECNVALLKAFPFYFAKRDQDAEGATTTFNRESLSSKVQERSSQSSPGKPQAPSTYEPQHPGEAQTSPSSQTRHSADPSNLVDDSDVAICQRQSQASPGKAPAASNYEARHSADHTKSVDDSGVAICLGVDAEWKPERFKKSDKEPPSRVAVLQVCGEVACFVIQLLKMKQFPKRLRQLLEDPDVLKFGVGIEGDVKRLRQSFKVPRGDDADSSVSEVGSLSTPLESPSVVEHKDHTDSPQDTAARDMPQSGDDSSHASRPVLMRGCVDVRGLLSRIQGEIPDGKFTLQTLTKHFLGISLEKGFNSPQLSNWENPTLTQTQIDYAALDAYCSREIFVEMFARRAPVSVALAKLHKKRSPQGNSADSDQSLSKLGAGSRSHVAFVDSETFRSLTDSVDTPTADKSEPVSHIFPSQDLSTPTSASYSRNYDPHSLIEPSCTDGSDTSTDTLVSGDGSSFVQAEPFSEHPNDNTTSTLSSKSLLKRDVLMFCSGLIDVKYVPDPHLRPKKPATSLAPKEAEFKPREYVPNPKFPKSKYLMYGPDGNFAARLQRNRFNWYLDEGLGELISMDPPTIKLKFFPAHYGHSSSMRYMMCQCIGCGLSGEEQRLIRHQIVPRNYRRYMPAPYDLAPSRDIVALCQLCKDRAEFAYDQRRREICRTYSVPLGKVVQKDDVLEDGKRAAFVLLKSAKKLPQARADVFKSKCIALLAAERKVAPESICHEDLTAEVLKEICKLPSREMPHGEFVVRSLATEGAIQAFIAKWRYTFLHAVQPKFISDDFDIDDHTPAWRPPPGEEALPKHLRTGSKVTFDLPLTQPTLTTWHDLMPPYEDLSSSEVNPEEKNPPEQKGENAVEKTL